MERGMSCSAIGKFYGLRRGVWCASRDTSLSDDDTSKGHLTMRIALGEGCLRSKPQVLAQACLSTFSCLEAKKHVEAAKNREEKAEEVVRLVAVKGVDEIEGGAGEAADGKAWRLSSVEHAQVFVP
eukprot:6489922-Amphidinium_carterae.1